jgi:3-oxoacyl-[acyl-carrier protein] reductase
MDLGLKDKVALVLASSKGLGKAVAIELAKEGAKVIICGTDYAALDSTRRQIHSVNKNVSALVCDLTDAAQRKNLVNQSLSAYGRIDILVTNTGGPPSGNFEQFNLEDWKYFYELMFISAVDVIQQVVPAMKQRKFGRILAITSITLRQPVDNLIASNSVRSSLLGLVKSLSNELAMHGITVNNLLPGFTQTERLGKLIERNPKLNDVKDTIPMKRFGAPEEFASAAAFLVSERASYITGQALAVDGGWVKGY